MTDEMTIYPPGQIAALPAVDELHRDIAGGWVRDALWAAIADLFERYREEQGLTYAELGRRVARSRGQIQRWLSAPVNMTLASAGLLAEGLDADLSVKLEPRCHTARGANEVCPADVAQAMVAATSDTRQLTWPAFAAGLSSTGHVESLTVFVCTGIDTSAWQSGVGGFWQKPSAGGDLRVDRSKH